MKRNSTTKTYNTPVLLIIFNRPNTTRKVFDAIRRAKPSKLFVAADGPREGVSGEAELCQAARDIIKEIDWNCELYTNFREGNLGLKLSMSSGIDWFFENVEEGIILEDDCLPTHSFFWFCQDLLEKYRNDDRIMAISGSNCQFGTVRGEASYYFSKIPSVWGWASWRRAWRYFDLSMSDFIEFKEQNQIKNVFQDKVSRVFWMTKIENAYNGANSWAFPWVYSTFTQNGLCIYPNVNLISNIGFGPNAVHARNPKSLLADIKTEDIFEIIHPKIILPDRDADIYFSKLIYKEQMPSSITRFKKSVVKFIKMILPIGCVNKLRTLQERLSL